MHLSLKLLDGRFVTLEVNPSDTIQDIKRKLFSSETNPCAGLPMAAFHIVFAGRPLPDECTVSDARLVNFSKTNLVINKLLSSDSRNAEEIKMDDALFRNRDTRLVWSLVYLDKGDERQKPFDRVTATVITGTLPQVMTAYQQRRADAHKGRIPYIAATVMNEGWNAGSIVIEGDKSSGELPYTMNPSGEDFNRPVLALYVLSDDGSRFDRIPNPLYKTQPLAALSHAEFSAAFATERPGLMARATELAARARGASAPALPAATDSAAATATPVVRASTQRLDFISRFIVNTVTEQIRDFSAELTLEQTEEGVKSAIEALLLRYQHGAISSTTRPDFTGIESELAREICSEIAVVVEYPTTPERAELTSDALFSSAVACLQYLQKFSFPRLLAYLELTTLFDSAAAPYSGAPSSEGPAGAGSAARPTEEAGPAVAGSAARPSLTTTKAPEKLVVLDVEGTIRDSTVDERTQKPGLQYQNIARTLASLHAKGYPIVLATGLREPALATVRTELDKKGIGQYISHFQPQNASGSAEGESKAEKIASYLTQFRHISPDQVYYFDDLPDRSTQADEIRTLGVNFYHVDNLAHDTSLAELLTQLDNSTLRPSHTGGAASGFSHPHHPSAPPVVGLGFPGGAYGDSRLLDPSAPPVGWVGDGNTAALKANFVLNKARNILHSLGSKWECKTNMLEPG
jgi:large subunit ribosomal protein L40e